MGGSSAVYGAHLAWFKGYDQDPKHILAARDAVLRSAGEVDMTVALGFNPVAAASEKSGIRAVRRLPHLRCFF